MQSFLSSPQYSRLPQHTLVGLTRKPGISRLAPPSRNSTPNVTSAIGIPFRARDQSLPTPSTHRRESHDTPPAKKPPVAVLGRNRHRVFGLCAQGGSHIAMPVTLPIDSQYSVGFSDMPLSVKAFVGQPKDRPPSPWRCT